MSVWWQTDFIWGCRATTQPEVSFAWRRSWWCSKESEINSSEAELDTAESEDEQSGSGANTNLTSKEICWLCQRGTLLLQKAKVMIPFLHYLLLQRKRKSINSSFTIPTHASTSKPMTSTLKYTAPKSRRIWLVLKKFHIHFREKVTYNSQQALKESASTS